MSAAPRRRLSRPARRPAERASSLGDEVLAVDGEAPRDVIEYRLLADEAEVALERATGAGWTVERRGGQGGRRAARASRSTPPLFDQVRTCDNHCEFCFIYQLPPGHAEEPLPEGRRLPAVVPLRELHHAHPLHRGRPRAGGHRGAVAAQRVSIHATDPDGAGRHAAQPPRRPPACAGCGRCSTTASRCTARWWCAPGVNDGAVLDDTLAGVLDEYPELAALCVVPLGVSRLQHARPACAPTPWPRPAAVRRLGRELAGRCPRRVLGPPPGVRRRRVLPARRPPVPRAEAYEGFAMHEDGIGMARTFELEFAGADGRRHRRAAGFFAWVDGAPAEGYRAPRSSRRGRAVRRAGRRRPCGRRAPARPRGHPHRRATAPQVLGTAASTRLGRDDVRLVVVNRSSAATSASPA